MSGFWNKKESEEESKKEGIGEYYLENDEREADFDGLAEQEAEQGQENEQTQMTAQEAELITSLLDERILRAVKEMGFEKFSPIQEQAIPYLLQGEDIIGQAQTGTGKTAAFGIPIIQQVDNESKKLQAIILCPTRELAIQAAEEIRKLAKYMHGIKVLPVYGGQEISRQIIGLKGAQIVVGTPGRVMDHMRRHTIKLDAIRMVVLDEADEMLNMGFREDMETILGEISNEHQTALFSATMPKPILDITNQFQKDAKLIKVAAKELTIPLVSQKYYRIKREDKDAACIRLLEYYQPKLTLIFCNTKRKVDELAEVLKQHGYQAEGLHGDMSQHQRDVAMGRFRKGSTNILIATDVAARGIDVDDVEAVINYDIPQDIEYYVHRIGRTGRAGRTGRSFTFVSGREIYQLRDIERICHTTVEEKKLPGAGKVLKSKADRYLNKAWELREHEDIELMKSFLEQKLEQIDDGDILELAAAMLKLQIGDKTDEIQADDYVSQKSKKGGRRESGRGSRGGRSGFGRREERKARDSFGKKEERSAKEGFGRKEERIAWDGFGRGEEKAKSRHRKGESNGSKDGKKSEHRESFKGASKKKSGFGRGEERKSRKSKKGY